MGNQRVNVFEVGHWSFSFNSNHKRMQEGLVFIVACMLQNQEQSLVLG